jgi:hypothetical protein
VKPLARWARLGSLVVCAATSACALARGSAPEGSPAYRAENARAALDRDAFGVARHELHWLAARCEAREHGRRALLLLAAMELAPENPHGSPLAAARAAASYLLLPDPDPEALPLARSLYRLAVDMGGPPGDAGSDHGSGPPLMAARFDTCAPGAASGASRALPTTPVVTSVERALAQEAALMARADSLDAMVGSGARALQTLEQRVSAERSRVAELEAELERITALLRDGPRSGRPPAGR